MIILLVCLLLFTVLITFLVKGIDRISKEAVAFVCLSYFALSSYIYSRESLHIFALMTLQTVLFWILFDLFTLSGNMDTSVLKLLLLLFSTLFVILVI